MKKLNEREQKDFDAIINTYYMKSIIAKLNEIYFIKYGVINSLDYLHEVILSCKDDVEILLNGRLQNGNIKDIAQARKAVVGNMFPNAIMYVFWIAKQQSLVPDDLFATTKTKDKIFNDYITINVGGETQKPDMDLIFYRLQDNNKLKNCVIVSLKTSLRDRSSQTYIWKLLLEIATSQNSIKDKYNISFNSMKMPKVCFATINFYNEINNPQHRGMFKFFDGSFIGKPIKSDFISNLSELFNFAIEQTNE